MLLLKLKIMTIVFIDYCLLIILKALPVSYIYDYFIVHGNNDTVISICPYIDYATNYANSSSSPDSDDNNYYL